MTEAWFNLFSYDFMRTAFLAGSLAAVLAGSVGYFVVMRHLSFAAHALGHISFAGASGALLIGLSAMTGQLMITLFAALCIGLFGEHLNRNDLIIGVILSFCLGLGTLFLHFTQGYAGQAMVILFGNILSVSDTELISMIVITLLCFITLCVIARRLLFASIDPILAEAKGISLYGISLIFIILMAAAVTLASQIVGIILVFTLIIGPPAIAQQWCRHFWTGLSFSILLALIIVWAGITLSFYTDWPISFWISTLVFVLYPCHSIFNYLRNLA